MLHGKWFPILMLVYFCIFYLLFWHLYELSNEQYIPKRNLLNAHTETDTNNHTQICTHSHAHVGVGVGVGEGLDFSIRSVTATINRQQPEVASAIPSTRGIQLTKKQTDINITI